MPPDISPVSCRETGLILWHESGTSDENGASLFSTISLCRMTNLSLDLEFDDEPAPPTRKRKKVHAAEEH